LPLHPQPTKYIIHTITCFVKNFFRNFFNFSYFPKTSNRNTVACNSIVPSNAYNGFHFLFLKLMSKVLTN